MFCIDYSTFNILTIQINIVQNKKSEKDIKSINSIHHIPTEKSQSKTNANEFVIWLLIFYGVTWEFFVESETGMTERHI